MFNIELVLFIMHLRMIPDGSLEILNNFLSVIVIETLLFID
jgi:hypothetical protein